MVNQPVQRKPKYFFAVFGDPSSGKPKAEAGYYPHEGYISSLNMEPGDVILLYCTSQYSEHPMESPGIGIVTRTTNDYISYQYFPLDKPVGFDTIKENLKNYENRLKVLWSKGNWLFEIASTSFRSVLKGRQIDWP